MEILTGRKHAKSKGSSSPGEAAGEGWEVFQRQLISESVLDNKGISQARRARESALEAALAGTWRGGGHWGQEAMPFITAPALPSSDLSSLQQTGTPQARDTIQHDGPHDIIKTGSILGRHGKEVMTKCVGNEP